MHVTVHTQHYKLSPSIERFALENLQEPLERIWDRDGSALEIHLRDLRGTKGGLDKECRAVFQMSAGPKLVITEVTEDMRKSIHQVRKRLMRRTRRYIGQRTDESRRHRKHFFAKILPGDLVGRRMLASADVPRARETHG